MGLAGNGIGIENYRLRLLVLVFLGIIALGSVLYWRQQNLLASSYAEIPEHRNLSSHSELKSKNYQIDVEDVSPSLK